MHAPAGWQGIDESLPGERRGREGGGGGEKEKEEGEGGRKVNIAGTTTTTAAGRHGSGCDGGGQLSFVSEANEVAVAALSLSR